MANLAKLLCRTYELNASGDYLPADTAEFKLQVRNSKYAGRPQYLQLRQQGNARPQFVSSLWEARTKAGIYNIEIERKRYEVVKTDTGIRIEPLPYRRKQEASAQGPALRITAEHITPAQEPAQGPAQGPAASITAEQHEYLLNTLDELDLYEYKVLLRNGMNVSKFVGMLNARCGKVL